MTKNSVGLHGYAETTDSVRRKSQDAFEFSVNSDSESDLADIFTEYIVWIGKERHFHNFGNVAFAESLYVDNI